MQRTQAKGRCISAEQAADVAETFGPASGTINSTCDVPEIKTTERTVSWRLTWRPARCRCCRRVQFDTPRHNTAMVASQGRMAGTPISDVKTGIEGERLGKCQQ